MVYQQIVIKKKDYVEFGTKLLQMKMARLKIVPFVVASFY